MNEPHERCWYCNKVSSRDIETDAEGFSKKRFFRDNDIPIRVVCEDCKEIIEDLLLDYEAQDDVYGWKIANDNEELDSISSVNDFEEEDISYNEIEDY